MHPLPEEGPGASDEGYNEALPDKFPGKALDSTVLPGIPAEKKKPDSLQYMDLADSLFSPDLQYSLNHYKKAAALLVSRLFPSPDDGHPARRLCGDRSPLQQKGSPPGPFLWKLLHNHMLYSGPAARPSYQKRLSHEAPDNHMSFQAAPRDGRPLQRWYLPPVLPLNLQKPPGNGYDRSGSVAPPGPVLWKDLLSGIWFRKSAVHSSPYWNPG